MTLNIDANPNAPIIEPGSRNGRPEGWSIPEGETFILGLDIDNVCGNYNDAFRWHVARHFGIDPTQLEPVSSWDYTDLNWRSEERRVGKECPV